MEKLTEFIVKELVDNKDDVKVALAEDETAFVVTVNVHADDMGRVIGKMGKTANAIRTIVKAFAGKDIKKKIIVKFN